MKKATISLVILLALAVAVSAQTPPDRVDRFQNYAVAWSGSVAAGTTFAIAVPNTQTALKATYPVAIEIISDDAVPISVYISPTTMPSTTAITPTPLNTSIPAEFRGYANTNASGGLLIASRPASVYHNINLEAVKLAPGRSNGRCFYVVIPATATTSYITVLASQK